MALTGIQGALGALAVAGGLVLPGPAPATPTLAADSAVLAAALAGPTLTLTMRGTSVAVLASASPAEGGCAALVSAYAPGRARRWNRLFRWSEVAWAGETVDGHTMVSFFDQAARLPADSLVFAPVDGAAFRAALVRVTAGCRANRSEGERIIASTSTHSRSCYFAALPALLLVDSPTPPPLSDPPRAVLSVLARENPEAELQLLLERAAPDPAADGDDWGQPEVAFTYADPRVKDLGITRAAFLLDGRPVAARHAIMTYGDTRLRIRMDPFAAREATVGAASFYRQLVTAGEVRLALLDSRQRRRVMLNFDAGAMLAAARRALRAADWSCTAAAPAPTPAARWQPAS